jgi:F0F1-type ATP synthase delta subunit
MFNLPPEVYSLQQLDAVISELTTFAKQSEQAAVKAKVSGKATTLAAEFSPEVAAVIKAAGKDEQKPDELAALAEELTGLRDSAPQVHITLAAMPAEGLKKQLAAWLRQNLNPQVLITFGYHTALLGGMVVRTGSRTFDWSFRRQILAAAPQFAERLHNV